MCGGICLSEEGSLEKERRGEVGSVNNSSRVDIERKGKEITTRCSTSAPCSGISVLESRAKREVVGSEAIHNFPHSFLRASQVHYR